MKHTHSLLVGLILWSGLIRQLANRRERKPQRPQQVSLRTTDGLELFTWVPAG